MIGHREKADDEDGDRGTGYEYEVRIAARLDAPYWREWFDGVDMHLVSDEETVLIGEFPDQAALHGLLAKLRDLNLPLISIKPLTGRIKERSE